jgi:hypothetical protein
MNRWPRRVDLVGAVVLTAALVSTTTVAVAAAPARCDVRLEVELTPDVANPRDEGFLGSLLSNQVEYLLSSRQERNSDSLLVLELTGPGPAYRCRQAIEVIRRDGRVLSVRVSKAPS